MIVRRNLRDLSKRRVFTVMLLRSFNSRIKKMKVYSSFSYLKVLKRNKIKIVSGSPSSIFNVNPRSARVQIRKMSCNTTSTKCARSKVRYS